MAKDEFNPEIIRAELVRRLAEIQQRRPGYSVRQFAAAMKMDYSSFSRIISGKRKISEKSARHLRSRLMVISEDLGLPLDIRPRELTREEHRLLSSWVSPAIQELTHTRGFDSTCSSIAARLGLAEKDVQKVVDSLISIGFLVRTPDGRLRDSVPVWFTDQYESDPQLKAANVQDLKDLNARAERTYAGLPEDETSFSSLLIATDSKKLAKARELIAQFRKDMLALLRTREPTEVYAIKIDMFPLTGSKK